METVAVFNRNGWDSSLGLKRTVEKRQNFLSAFQSRSQDGSSSTLASERDLIEAWLAQHRSYNGDQVCSSCWKCPIPRGSISKAVQRVAATQAKVAVRAAQEKRHVPSLMSGLPSRQENGVENRTAGKRRKQSRGRHSTDKTTEQKWPQKGLQMCVANRRRWCARRMAGLPPRNGNGKKNRRAPKRRKLRRAQSNGKKTTEQKEPRTQMQKWAADSRRTPARRRRWR